MLAPFLTRSPAQARRVTSVLVNACKVVALTLSLTLIGACSALPPAPVAGADPAGATARVPRTTSRGVAGPYVSARPVGAKSWQEQNERGAPGEKP